MIASPPPPRAVTVDRDLDREAEPNGLDFGALLRRYRTEAGLSQEALAERANLSVRAIRALENGERQAPYPATVGAGGTVLAFLGGYLGYRVAAEDPFEGDASFVPDLARRTKGRVCYIAGTTGRAACRADLAVQHLDDVEDGYLLGGYGEAEPAVRPAVALEYPRPPEVAEDLLQESLGDVLTARDLIHP